MEYSKVVYMCANSNFSRLRSQARLASFAFEWEDNSLSCLSYFINIWSDAQSERDFLSRQWGPLY